MNYIKKIYNYIKLFFDKDKFKEDLLEVKEQISDNTIDYNIHDESDVEELVEDKSIINESDLDQTTKNLKFGDIIVANRYRTLEEKEKIPVGHRDGPAIVLCSENNKLYCIFGTGVKPESFVSENAYFIIEPGNYNLTKNTYFSMSPVYEMEYHAVQEVLGEMNSEDIKKFTKKYIIMRNRGVYKNTKSLGIEMPLEVGDVFKYNQEHFLIINVDEKNYICFKLQTINNVKGENSILIDRKYYDINYENPISISKKINSVIISTLKSNQILSILKRYEEHMKNKNNQTIAQRGSLIRKNNNLYFIYGENGNKWLTFKVSKSVSSGSKFIKINDNYYYTEFNELIEINKNDEYEVLCLATNDEINNIINLKKETIRQRKVVDKKSINKDVKSNFPNFLPGEVVKTKTMCDDKYIIVNRYAKYVYCVNIDNIKNGNFRVEYFDIKLLVSLGKIQKKYYDIVDANSIKLKDSIKKLELKF